MDLALKLAPAVISLGTAALAQMYDSNDKLQEWHKQHMKLKVYNISILCLGACGLMQLARMQLTRGNYTHIVNVTAMTIVLELLNRYDTNINWILERMTQWPMQWPTPFIIAILTYVNW